MAQINLAPGTQYLAAVRKRRRALYFLTTIIALAAFGAWVTLFMIERRVETDKEAIEANLSAVEAEITRAGEDVARIELFEKRLAVVDDLLDNHITWAPLLQEIERLLPPATVLTNLEARQGVATVDVQGVTPNLDELAQALASITTSDSRQTLFADAHFSTAELRQQTDADGAVTSTGYSFGASFEMKP